MCFIYYNIFELTQIQLRTLIAVDRPMFWLQPKLVIYEGRKKQNKKRLGTTFLKDLLYFCNSNASKHLMKHRME